MAFHPFRHLQHSPDLSVLEGLLTLENPALPNILLVIITCLFQTPHSSPLFVFTSLPLLIHLAESQFTTDLFTKTLISFASGTGATIGGTTWGLLPNFGEKLLGTAVMSTLISFASVSAVSLHRQVLRARLLKEGNWDAIVFFGLLWAGVWALFSHISPFGRFGVPSLFPADMQLVARATRYIGPTGVDFLLGSTAYAAYETGVSLVNMRSEIADIPYRSPPSPNPGSGIHSAESSQASRAASAAATGTEHHSAGDTVGVIAHMSGKSAALALTTAAAALATWREPETQSTSDSLDLQTPFGLGFVLPQGTGHWQLHELVHSAQTFGNRANLLVFRESAYYAYDSWDRQVAIDTFVRDVCQQYGGWVQLGVDSPSEHETGRAGPIIRRMRVKVNEVILIGPNGVVGSYRKQKLIPYVESFPFHQGIMPVPTCRSSFPRIPHLRTIKLSPLICLDAFHPDLVSRLDPTPDLIVVSASALTIDIAKQMIGQAESIALCHSVPVMVVASSRGRSAQGISALLDGWGRVIHQQRGGRSFVVQVALPYYGSVKRGRSAGIGSRGVFGCGIVILMVSAAVKRARKMRHTSNSFPMEIFRYLQPVHTSNAPSERSVLIFGQREPDHASQGARRSSRIRAGWGVAEERSVGVDAGGGV